VPWVRGDALLHRPCAGGSKERWTQFACGGVGKMGCRLVRLVVVAGRSWHVLIAIAFDELWSVCIYGNNEGIPYTVPEFRRAC